MFKSCLLFIKIVKNSHHNGLQELHSFQLSILVIILNIPIDINFIRLFTGFSQCTPQIKHNSIRMSIKYLKHQLELLKMLNMYISTCSKFGFGYQKLSRNRCKISEVQKFLISLNFLD